MPPRRRATASVMRSTTGGGFARTAATASRDYARFLNANPGWPEESKLRGWAEKSDAARARMPATVLSFFSSKQPETGNGFARLADALSATGRAPEALVGGQGGLGVGRPQRSRRAERSSPATAQASRWQDHDSRTDALLFAKDPTDAQRFLPMTSATRRAAFTARVAMQSRWPDAETRYQAVIGQVTTDAGLMMDRARYLRDANWESAARQLFARDHTFTYRPADSERFLDMQILLADGAAQEAVLVARLQYRPPDRRRARAGRRLSATRSSAFATNIRP